MKSVLVTGGSGFIGSNIVRTLLDKEYQVSVFDNLYTSKKDNLYDVMDKIKFIHGDIRNLDAVTKAVNNVDYILHQAALPSVGRSVKNPIESHDCNVTGSLNIMEAARKSDIEMIIFASSSSVYGNTKVLPKREEMELNPLSPYAVTKVAMEYYFSVFSKVYDLKSIGFRYFNVYGPRQSPESEYAAVIPKFIKSSLSNTSPVIYGDGEQTRDFTYVGDVVNANILAMESKRITHDIFNIGGGEAISVNQLLQKINKITGNGVKAQYTDSREGDIKDSLADISKVSEKLGYKPEHDIESGLKETIKWFKGSKYV